MFASLVLRGRLLGRISAQCLYLISFTNFLANCTGASLGSCHLRFTVRTQTSFSLPFSVVFSSAFS